MQVQKLSVKTKCETPTCKNNASYQFCLDSGDKRNSLNLCEDCMREIYGHIGKILTPKSPKNMLNKKSGGERV